ncbi:hypothetical protein [Candidatus Aalborgicola defluviihabitans]|uniref:hypothetical protein n=1 Tax=Candidatus Aalborgicola defluviihabitans TaxID=3386187 RepID=UPI001EBE41B5|nr:hypothetical protein [Burkholderiales bacterium]
MLITTAPDALDQALTPAVVKVLTLQVVLAPGVRPVTVMGDALPLALMPLQSVVVVK